jgi:chorismate mutase/prephenate dehydratase
MSQVPGDSDLSAHRNRIDAIDREVVRLLNERATAASAIGAAKAARGEAVFAPGREQQVFERIAAANTGPLPDRALRAVWREVMSACRALEQPLTVCHFGQPGAFTHLAARLKFGSAVSYAAADDIGAVFGEVEKGRADYGVVPIENSTDGSITDTIDAFLATRLRIVAELHLRIRHHLMGGGSRDGLQRVYSRNTVFGQCRRWLAANLPGVELVETSSTTKAAERAAVEAGAGAIGSEDAAKAFGLPILASDIQDDPNNVTRFVVIAAADRASAPTGDDKTSLMFGIADRPGALYDCLTPFHQGGINLTRIESRPNRRRAWEYLFFIDLIGHHRDATVQAAVERLRAQASEVGILGSYPRASAPLNG